MLNGLNHHALFLNADRADQADLGGSEKSSLFRQIRVERTLRYERLGCPRRLLQAAAAGIPVIATAACGVDGVSNVTTVNAGESNSLRELMIDHIR